jgi:serine/threonine-protein kinase RsbW
VIAISPRPIGHNWDTISFPSTLYLIPILDRLLSKVPGQWRPELRLGLQEALVNAAKHGNNLDPTKKVSVQFWMVADEYWWSISDQGLGFEPDTTQCCHNESEPNLPCHDGECGRGLFILHQIFDQVYWSRQGTELRLCKQVSNSTRPPVVL